MATKKAQYDHSHCAFLWDRAFAERPLWGSVLGGKGSATATGVGGIGVVEGKTTVVEAILEVDFHADQVDTVRLVHEYADAVGLKFLVVGFLGVKTQNISKA